MRVIGGLVAIAVTLGVGYWLVGSHLGYWGEEVRGGITDATSDEHITRMAEDSLAETRNELKNHWGNIYNVKAESAKLQGVVNAQRKRLVEEEQILKRGQELLAEKEAGDEILIGGVIYTYTQVNDDVLDRVGSCEVLRRKILNDEQSLSKLQKAYEDGCKVISDQVKILRQKRIEFEAEKAELAALRAQSHVNEIIGKVYSASEIKTELGRAKQAFDKRLNKLRADAEFEKGIGSSKSDVIKTWDTELGIPTETAVNVVEKYFQVDSPSSPLEALKESVKSE
ncbi:MAG: hypothetical protein ABH956_01985 [Candidatus Nealsonbacteria bacterium]